MERGIGTKGDGSAIGMGIDEIDRYLRGLSETVDRVSREEIREVVDVLLAACRARKRVYLVGNGGSATTASHIANDLSKQAIVDGHPKFRAIALTDNMPLVTAWANDEDYSMVFYRQLDNHVEPGDVVIAISTSGQSRNVIRALELARERGAVTIGLTGSDGGAMCGLLDHCIFVPSADIGHQEAVHLALDHAITMAIRARIADGS